MAKKIFQVEQLNEDGRAVIRTIGYFESKEVADAVKDQLGWHGHVTGPLPAFDSFEDWVNDGRDAVAMRLRRERDPEDYARFLKLKEKFE